MGVGKVEEGDGGEKENKNGKEGTDHKTTMLKFPSLIAVSQYRQALPLLHLRHRLVRQQWLSNCLTETHSHEYILYCGPRKVLANNA